MNVKFFQKKLKTCSIKDKPATIFVRVRIGREYDVTRALPLSVGPYFWDNTCGTLKSRVIIDSDLRNQIEQGISKLTKLIVSQCTRMADEGGYPVASNWLDILISRVFGGEKHYENDTVIVKSIRKLTNSRIDENTGKRRRSKKDKTFFNIFDTFLREKEISDTRRKNFECLKRKLMRYESYISFRDCNKSYRHTLSNINNSFVRDFWNYLLYEYRYIAKYPRILEQHPEFRIPKRRGRNGVIDTVTRLRTFTQWCLKNKLMKNNPFDDFKIPECAYTNPVYLTREELQKIFEHDFSDDPRLDVQRDIFIMQSMIGCRVSDLSRLTTANIVEGAIEYIPKKTKEMRADRLRIPINEKGWKIIGKYTDYQDKHDGQLLPFISDQKYNYAIKDVLRACQINRMVTVLDQETWLEKRVRISDIASSHMARRNCVGNLYKMTKDPNIVSSMSGHKAGSRAFSRYREIDDDIKNELIESFL